MSPEDEKRGEEVRRILQDEARKMAQEVIDDCRARGGLFALPSALARAIDDIKTVVAGYGDTPADEKKALLNLGRINGVDMAGIALVALLREYEARLN